MLHSKVSNLKEVRFNANASVSLRNKHRETMLEGLARLDKNTTTLETRHDDDLGLWQTFRPISPPVQPTDCRVTSFMEPNFCYIRFDVLTVASH